MRALQVIDHKLPPSFGDAPIPVPAAGEVLIRISACGLNFADLLVASGSYQDIPPLPCTLGMEVAGTVIGAGPDTEAPAPGTRVAAYGGHGGLAEFGVFPAANCLPVPVAMPDEIVAGLQVAYGTSYLALTRRARLNAGETLVVYGASGGVGQTAVEIGRMLGARVIGIARGADKLEAVRQAGADLALDGGDDIVTRLKAEGGADVVYDPVGGQALTDALRYTNREGRIITIGFASGTVPQIPANHLLVKNIDVIGFYWGGYHRFNPAAVSDSLADVLRHCADGRLSPRIGTVLPFDRAIEGLDLLRTRKAIGKVVIRIRDQDA